MVKLERIVPGSRLTGVSGDGEVEILSARAYGADAVEVTWRGPEGLGDRILFREDESRLREVSPARRFTFDGDGHLFRLASEALRIRLAHLFDPQRRGERVADRAAPASAHCGLMWITRLVQRLRATPYSRTPVHPG